MIEPNMKYFSSDIYCGIQSNIETACVEFCYYSKINLINTDFGNYICISTKLKTTALKKSINIKKNSIKL